MIFFDSLYLRNNNSQVNYNNYNSQVNYNSQIKSCRKVHQDSAEFFLSKFDFLNFLPFGHFYVRYGNSYPINIPIKWQVWFLLAQWFLRRRLKCNSLQTRTTDAEWWQYLTLPFGLGELKTHMKWTFKHFNILEQYRHLSLQYSQTCL